MRGSAEVSARPRGLIPSNNSVFLRPAHGGMTSYHALNFSAQKRFGQGLGFLLAYTLSKNLNSGRDGGVFRAPGVVHEGYGGNRVRYLSGFDRTHNVGLYLVLPPPLRTRAAMGRWRLGCGKPGHRQLEGPGLAQLYVRPPDLPGPRQSDWSSHLTRSGATDPMIPTVRIS